MTDYLALSNHCLPATSKRLRGSEGQFGDSLQIVNPETGANLVQLLTSLDNSAEREKNQQTNKIGAPTFKRDQLGEYQYQSLNIPKKIYPQIKLDKQKVRIASIIQEKQHQRQITNELENIIIYQENKILEKQIQKLLQRLNQQTCLSQALVRQISENNTELNVWRSKWYQKQHHYQYLCMKDQENLRVCLDSHSNLGEDTDIKIVQVVINGSKQESTSCKLTNAHTSITDNLGFSFNKSCQHEAKPSHKACIRQYIDEKRGSMSEAQEQINILMNDNHNYQSLKVCKDSKKKNKSLSTQESFEFEQLFRKTLPISMSFAPKLNQTCAKNMYKKIVPNTAWGGDEKKQDIIMMRRRLVEKREVPQSKVGELEDKTNIQLKNKGNLKSEITIKDWDKYKRAKIFNKSEANKKAQQKGKQSGRTKVSTFKIDVRNMK